MTSLQSIYYDVKHPASFGGVKKLARAAKVSRREASQFLASQETYTLHKQVSSKFKRRKTIAFGVHELVQIDLIDYKKYARLNSGNKFILVIIDVFSRFCYTFPIKNKTGLSVSLALEQFLKKANPPVVNLQSDRGLEFYNVRVNKLLKKYRINHYSTNSKIKASICERVIRTIKSRLHRVFTYRKSYKYTDVLPFIVSGYNFTVHSAHGLSPNEALTAKASEVFLRLFGYNSSVRFKLNIGDFVRLSKIKKTFHKGYLPSWTREIFIINDRFSTNPPTYLIKDFKNSVLQGRFYEQELQRVDYDKDPSIWIVEKVIKSRTIGGIKEFFVKWKGFTSKHNSWIQAWRK